MRFEVHLLAAVDGGMVQVDGDGLQVRDASEVTLYLSAATSFAGYDRSPVSEGRDAGALAAGYLERSASEVLARLCGEAHVSDHRALFDRVELDLGGTPTETPTDQRIAKAGVQDPRLVTLLFQYGRYLLIASSRPGTPAGESPGPLERPGACALELQLDAQHQRRDELLAGRDGQPRRAARAPARLHRRPLGDGGEDRSHELRRPRLGRASQLRPLAAVRAGRRLRPRRPRLGALGRWADRGSRSISSSTMPSAATWPTCATAPIP